MSTADTMSTSTSNPQGPKPLVESDVMPTICAGWQGRARDLGLPKKGAKRDSDAEAYMQGALQALLACGVITHERTGQIGFLTAVGRLPQFIADNAAKVGG